MVITRAHIDFWQARPLPAFAVAHYAELTKRARLASYPPTYPTRARLVDECVNAHAGIRRTDAERSAANFVALLKLWRNNAARGAHHPPETLRAYLMHLWRSDSHIGRANVAGRMLRKLTKE